MVSYAVRLLAIVAIATAAWAVHGGRTVLAAAALLVLLCGVVGVLWLRAGRRGDRLDDPAVSTLVFPPESKFEQSVLPPR